MAKLKTLYTIRLSNTKQCQWLLNNVNVNGSLITIILYYYYIIIIIIIIIISTTTTTTTAIMIIIIMIIKIIMIMMMMMMMMMMISNSNRSTDQGEIARVFQKSDEREARNRSEITSTIVRHKVQLPINRINKKFRNKKILSELFLSENVCSAFHKF